MKRFEFPLERVRRWRSEQASLEELKLQQLRAEKERLIAGRMQLLSELAHTQRQVLEQPFMDPQDLASLDSFRLHVRNRVHDFENRERASDAGIVAQRQRVLEARRQFQLLERLRGKAHTEWRAAGDKEEEALAAELFLAKSIRER